MVVCGQERRGAACIDGQSFSDVKAQGLANFVRGIPDDLVADWYKPMPNRRVEIRRGMAKFERFRFLVSARLRIFTFYRYS
jgi:hypothetical protein